MRVTSLGNHAVVKGCDPSLVLHDCRCLDLWRSAGAAKLVKVWHRAPCLCLAQVLL